MLAELPRARAAHRGAAASASAASPSPRWRRSARARPHARARAPARGGRARAAQAPSRPGGRRGPRAGPLRLKPAPLHRQCRGRTCPARKAQGRCRGRPARPLSAGRCRGRTCPALKAPGSPRPGEWSAPTGAGQVPPLLVAVDDPAAVQIVRRELDLDPIAREDLDPVAPHLPGRVAERLVTVVERDPEHAVAQGLDDLTLELDLLFLRCDGNSLQAVRNDGTRPVRSLTVAQKSAGSATDAARDGAGARRRGSAPMVQHRRRTDGRSGVSRGRRRTLRSARRSARGWPGSG